jgi:hypothetical protein
MRSHFSSLQYQIELGLAQARALPSNDDLAEPFPLELVKGRESELPCL